VDRRVIAEQLLLEHQYQLEERVEERTRALSEREALLEHMVHHDALTGLPNRTLLNIRLEQSIKHSARQHMMMGVVFIDIDRFKNINDSIGHVSGDKLLQQLAERLQNAVRAVDTVARISGDEFVVILEDIDSSDHAVLVMEKLMSTVRKPYVIDDAKVSATVSMGLSLYPDDGDDPATLLCNADAAMYQSKEGGRNSCQLFTGEMSAAVQERAFLESALHTALEEAQFRLVYQPKVDLQSGKYIGMEALLRWCHPDKGEISPAHFIPIAEQSGIIRDIGSWVLKTACAQGAAWLQERLAIGRIAVNVAGQQIQQSNFLYIVQSIIEETGLPPENLELEITESFVMRQAETGIEHLRKIRDLGVEIAIDDFGTGYSSLGYLKQLPIDRLKIDRSFVSEIPHDVNDMAICESVIGMGKALGIKIIAEGVEDEAHVAFLREKGCLEAQGYFFAKPLPPDEIARLFPRLGESSLSKPIG